MSKSMGFRNSGKLNLSGKQTEYAVAGGLLIVIVAAVVFAATQIWSCGSTPIGERGEPRVKCVKCGEEWTITREEEMILNRENEMRRGVPVGEDCEKCGGEGTVFLMNICPECKTYYLSKSITDPDKFAEGGNKEVCPNCGTDLNEWWREHRRRR